MNILLVLAFLFFIGSVSGWFLELFFRRFFSRANVHKKWINPGFCTGPYLPLYGSGLCVLFLIATLGSKNPHISPVAIFLIMAVSMTLIEYIAGIWALKRYNLRLWDYSNEWGNIQGIICPKFSLAWALIGGAYYFLVHPHILHALAWLSNNLAFSFFIGCFFGVFTIDVAHSTQLVSHLKQFAKENDFIVRFEDLKLHIRHVHDENKLKYHFFKPFSSVHPLTDHLRKMHEEIEAGKAHLR